MKCSCEPLHVAEQRLDDQLEPTYSSSVLIQDVALKTYRKQWTIGRSGKRGSGISALMAWHVYDDDDDNLALSRRTNPENYRPFLFLYGGKLCKFTGDEILIFSAVYIISSYSLFIVFNFNLNLIFFIYFSFSFLFFGFIYLPFYLFHRTSLRFLVYDNEEEHLSEAIIKSKLSVRLEFMPHLLRWNQFKHISCSTN